jgi:hypothetical protein
MFFWIQLADFTAAEKKKNNNNHKKINCDGVKEVGLNEFFPRRKEVGDPKIELEQRRIMGA